MCITIVHIAIMYLFRMCTQPYIVLMQKIAFIFTHHKPCVIIYFIVLTVLVLTIGRQMTTVE